MRAITRITRPSLEFQIRLQRGIVTTKDNDVHWSMLNTSQMKNLAYFYWYIILQICSSLHLLHEN